MTTTIEGINATHVEIHEPLFGAWFADVVADASEDISGAVALVVEGVTWQGTVFRGGIESGHWAGRVVAGNDGLRTAVDAKQYRSSNVRGLLDELCTASGETLDTDNSDAATLTRVVPRWHRNKGTVGSALLQLMRSLGTAYRISRSGLLVVADDTWPELEVPGVIETGKEPHLGIRTVGPDSPTVRPGVTFDGIRASYVVTRASSGGLRQEVWSA